MTQYKKILNNLEKGICEYGNDKTGVWFSLNGMFKYTDAKMIFYTTKKQMARAINKFIKIGY